MIDTITLGYLGVFVMLGLALAGIPLAYAMSGVATVGLITTLGFYGAATQNILLAWEQSTSFSLMTIPLFIVMGSLAYHTGIVADLFDATRKWIGNVPGGLAVAGVIASAAFGAVTGSTAASVATMSNTVLPELKRFKYDVDLSAGSVAASGGLAAIIPPSVFIIIFCVLTDQSIGELFIATIGPGLLVTALFCLYILIRCAITPSKGPTGPKCSWQERLACLPSSVPVIVVFGIVIGGIYAGLATPTEASAMGCVGVMVIALCMRRLNIKNLRLAFIDSAKLSAVILFLIIGGWLMSRFLVTTGTTHHMVDFIVGMNMSYYGLVGVMFLLFLVLGCVLESTSILILTMPFLFPITQAYGLSPAWFGIFVTMMMVLAGITPPVGLNVFVLHGVCPEIPITLIFKGALPFIAIMIISLAVTTIFPDVVLWLPRHMMGTH